MKKTAFKHIITLQMEWTSVMCSGKVSRTSENFPDQKKLFFHEKGFK